MEKREIMEYYHISKDTYYCSKEEEGKYLLDQLYPVGIERERVSEAQKKEVIRILDDILPVQSGRRYRYQEETDDSLYRKYLENVKKGWSVSKSYFIYTIMAGEYVHHSKKPQFCPHCIKFEEGDQSEKIIAHQQLIPIQRKKYLQEKKEIAEGDTDTILITQDFTQLELESGFVQDLIICCYWYDEESKGGLGREYCHFVGNKGETNGVHFVAGCWKQLLKEKWFKSPTKIIIWSDGGPKHFKVSANLQIFQAIQQTYPKIDWTYNFFPSYHGCSV